MSLDEPLVSNPRRSGVFKFERRLLQAHRMATILSPRDLARTYQLQTYVDAWDCVEDYRAVMEHHQKNPEDSPYLVGKEFDLPRGRVRTWIQGGMPDPVRAVTVADQRGWLDATWESDIGRAFNILVAYIFSSGSIGSRDFVPTFIVDGPETEDFVRQALDVVGCGAVRQHDTDPNRATQLVPRDHKAVLSRALQVLGAPVGVKNEQADITLPAYLDSDTTPESVRREFVEVYVALRGHHQAGRDGRMLEEDRPNAFYDALATLISSVGHGEVRPAPAGNGVWVRAETVSNLDLDLSGDRYH